MYFFIKSFQKELFLLSEMKINYWYIKFQYFGNSYCHYQANKYI